MTGIVEGVRDQIFALHYATSAFIYVYDTLNTAHCSIESKAFGQMLLSALHRMARLHVSLAQGYS